LRIGLPHAPAARPHAAAEESFVGVDVSDAGEQALVEQQLLDRYPAPARRAEEDLAARLQGVRSQTFEAGVALAGLQQQQLSELPHVAQVDLGPRVVEDQAQVGVGVGPEAVDLLWRECLAGRCGQQAHAARGCAEELSRHSEVEHQPAAVVQPGDQVLAVAGERLDRATSEAAAQALRPGQEEVAVRRGPDRADGSGDQEGLDALTRHFDFGELGHAGGVAWEAAGGTEDGADAHR
jgi:hypothetical protein